MTTITLATAQGLRSFVDGVSTPALLDDVDVTAIDTCDGELWAIVEEHELARVRDGNVDTVAKLEAPGTCLRAQRKSVWIGTAGAHLLRFADGTLAPMPAFDEAPSRAAWHTPWGGPPDTRWIDAQEGRLFVNVHVGGILVSEDDGASWRATLDLDVDVHQVSVDGGGIVWAATGAAGLGESRDHGRSWSFHTEGLHGTYLRAAVPCGDGIVVTASSGPHSRDGAVYRSDGERFTPCNGALPTRFAGNLDTGRLAAYGETAALAGLDGRLYVSDDAGHTFRVAATDLPPVREVLVAPH
jgi:hypothetical protein